MVEQVGDDDTDALAQAGRREGEQVAWPVEADKASALLAEYDTARPQARAANVSRGGKRGCTVRVRGSSREAVGEEEDRHEGDSPGRAEDEQPVGAVSEIINDRPDERCDQQADGQLDKDKPGETP